MPEYVIKCAPPITVAHLFLQGILAAVCPDFLRTKPHPDLHIQTPQWWHWLLQQCLQRARLLLNNWYCGVSFWASHCASPHYHSKFSLHMWKYFVDFHLVKTVTIPGFYVLCVEISMPFSLHQLLVYFVTVITKRRVWISFIDWLSVSIFLQQITWGACGLVMTGNAVIFLTIFGFFVVFGGGDDFSWEQW